MSLGSDEYEQQTLRADWALATEAIEDAGWSELGGNGRPDRRKMSARLSSGDECLRSDSRTPFLQGQGLAALRDWAGTLGDQT